MISTAGKPSIKPGGRRLPCTRSILHHSWTLPAMASVTFLGPCRAWIIWGNWSHLVRPSLLLRSPQIDMGYGVSDYYGIHPPYGTMEMLIDSSWACMTVVWNMLWILSSITHRARYVDTHYRRLSPRCWTNDKEGSMDDFQESRTSLRSRYWDYYIWKESNTMSTAIEGYQIIGRPLLAVHTTDRLV